MPLRFRALLLPLVVLLAGCSDVARFSTGPREAYCGQITEGAAFRSGLGRAVRMRLRLDAEALDRGELGGTLSTYEELEGVDEPARLLDEAELRPIGALAHDPLSFLDFGEGRLRNVLVSVSPRDPEASTLLAVVSLLDAGAVEVRLLRPGPERVEAGPRGALRSEVFGLFPLSKAQGTCGF